MILWNPYTTYVWSKQQVQQWYDANGERAFYDGKLWELVKKNLGVGRYSVSFKEWIPD